MISLATWAPSLETWQRCQILFAFADFLSPPNGTMWGWSCPSLNADTAMVCLSRGYHSFILSMTLQRTLPAPLAVSFVMLLKLQHKPDMYRNATRCHIMLTGYTTDSAWLLSLHHWSHQNHYMICLQKRVQTDSGSSDVLPLVLKQAWSCIKLWNH